MTTTMLNIRINSILCLLVMMMLAACSENEEAVTGTGIDIKVTNVEAVSAKVSFNPNSAEQYVASCIMADEYRQLGGDMAVIKALYGDAGVEDRLQDGKADLLFEDLRPATEYYAVAFGVTQQGEPVNVLYKQAFTTKDKGGMELNGVSFQLNVSDITFESAKIECVPSVQDASYYVGVMSQAEYDKWDIAGKGYDEYFFSLIDEGGLVMADVLKQGTTSGKYDKLEGETTYHAFAFTVSPSGTITSKVSEVTFKTEKSYFIEARFSLTATDLTASSARINAIPSDDRISYYYGIIPKADYEKYESDFDLMQKTIEELGAYIDNFIIKGTDSYYEYGLAPATAYYIIAFSYDKTTPTGYNSYLSKAEFVTLAE